MSQIQDRCIDDELLQQLLLGMVPQEQAVRLEDHVLGCRQCGDRLAGIRAEDTLVEAARGQATLTNYAGDTQLQRLMDQLCHLPMPTLHLRSRPPHVEGLDELRRFLGPAESDDELGRIGAYRVLDILGEGGMGIVLEAEDTQLGRRVALKVMKPMLAASPAAKARFLREARAAAAIQHDNVVTIHQVGEHQDLPYLAMQLLAGESLRRRLGRSGKLSPAETVRIGGEIATGLAAAHTRNVVHRDIKPDNIWLEAGSDRVKILDFGLAHVADDLPRLTQSGAVTGTPAYMAPEQVENAVVDPRADLFSLGCVLYECCTGRQAFLRPTIAATLMAVVQHAPRQLNAEVPRAPLSDLVMKLLEKDPARRPPGAAAVLAVLAGCGTATKPAAAKIGHGRAIAVILALAFFAIVAATILYIRTGAGTLVLEVNEPDVHVTIDGANVALRSPRDQIDVRVGKHDLSVSKDGFKTVTQAFEVSRGGRIELTARLEPNRTPDVAAVAGKATPRDSAQSKPELVTPAPSAKSPPADSPPPVATTVARLIHANGCHWAVGSRAQPGDDLLPGRKLVLLSGLAEVMFVSGARVQLQGPAEIEIGSGKSAVLNQGKLTVRIIDPDARGFEVRARGVKYTDLAASEFGLSVASEGSQQMMVFKGSVKAQIMQDSLRPPKSGNVPAETSLAISAGQGIRVAAGKFEPIKFDDSKFERPWAKSQRKPDAAPAAPSGAVATTPQQTANEVRPSPGIPHALALTGPVDIKLPSHFAHFCTGGAGRYLIFDCKDAGQVVIVDAVEARIVHRLEFPGQDLLIAADVDKLLVAAPTQKLLHRYSLQTFQREKSAPIPFDGPLRTMLMGNASNGPAALWSDGNIVLWDVEQMKPFTVEGDVLGGSTMYGFGLRVSADGLTFAGWTSGLSGQPFHVMTLSGHTSSVAATPEGFSMNGRWAQPNADASLIFHFGGLYTCDLKPIAAGTLGGAVLLPTEDARFFLAYRGQAKAPPSKGSQVSICTTADRRPVATVKNLENIIGGTIPPAWGYVGAEARIRYLPGSGRIIVVPDSDDRAVVRRFDLVEALEQSGEDYLVVISEPPAWVRAGDALNYQLDVLSKSPGVRYRLETAPQGMTLSASGLLHWDVPAQYESESAKVMIALSSGTGGEIFHSFEVQVDPVKPEER